MKKYIIFLPLVLILFSCSKASRRTWLVAEFTVVNQHTGLPVKAHVELEYELSTLFGGSIIEKVDLGDTDENGRMSIERKIDRNADHIKLNVTGDGFFYKFDGSIFDNDPTNIKPHRKIVLLSTSENVNTIYLVPIYAYELTVKNTSCFDATDSLWMTINGQTHLLTGCADSIMGYDQNPFIIWNPTNLTGFGTYTGLVVDMVTKKNSVVNSYPLWFNLESAAFTYPTIEY